MLWLTCEQILYTIFFLLLILIHSNKSTAVFEAVCTVSVLANYGQGYCSMVAKTSPHKIINHPWVKKHSAQQTQWFWPAHRIDEILYVCTEEIKALLYCNKLCYVYNSYTSSKGDTAVLLRTLPDYMVTKYSMVSRLQS